MKSGFVVLSLLGCVAIAPPVFGAEIVLYERDGFGGRSFSISQSISDFANIGFNDRASSVVVKSGSWQLCSDAFFRGRCVTIGRGEYPTLRSMQLENQISSAREVEWLADAGGGGLGSLTAPGLPSGSAERGSRVDVFDGVQFSGRAFAVNATISNFADIGFNDRTQSLVVRDGVWEACEHADFRGTCQTFGRGRYPNLGGLAGRISSIRPVGTDRERGGWGSGSRAVLYQGANLTGRSFVINSEVAANLARTGFNDRASSLRVEGGYWIFCSDANFAGECRTFGPGDYPTLPWELTEKISSGRRIHGNYPYNQNPNWPGAPGR